ncbi:MAG: hypothetical protein KGM24_08365 [Elusimicrobia bacterium]|nr:hypothetical protein [Elusimicrobiota bacterium]
MKIKTLGRASLAVIACAAALSLSACDWGKSGGGDVGRVDPPGQWNNWPGWGYPGDWNHGGDRGGWGDHRGDRGGHRGDPGDHRGNPGDHRGNPGGHRGDWGGRPGDRGGHRGGDRGRTRSLAQIAPAAHSLKVMAELNDQASGKMFDGSR